jgi:hypothetical protein
MANSSWEVDPTQMDDVSTRGILNEDELLAAQSSNDGIPMDSKNQPKHVRKVTFASPIVLGVPPGRLITDSSVTEIPREQIPKDAPLKLPVTKMIKSKIDHFVKSIPLFKNK